MRKKDVSYRFFTTTYPQNNERGGQIINPQADYFHVLLTGLSDTPPLVWFY